MQQTVTVIQSIQGLNKWHFMLYVIQPPNPSAPHTHKHKHLNLYKQPTVSEMEFLSVLCTASRAVPMAQSSRAHTCLEYAFRVTSCWTSQQYKHHKQYTHKRTHEPNKATGGTQRSHEIQYCTFRDEGNKRSNAESNHDSRQLRSHLSRLSSHSLQIMQKKAEYMYLYASTTKM
ncbi:hypothetical protein BaRGS_00027241 [Batillaria attramentaria]|uniref:Uncharacterized protein n=1 Tax=Batillaria attramentaria TaxID=370345 RepID=A0ABD0K2M5_9CAEN